MSGFMYFQPRGETLPAEYRDRCGNGITEIHAGPNDKPGDIFGGQAYDRSNTAYRCKYFPKQQSWRQIPKTECWIGYYVDELPSPEDLERDSIFPGHCERGWTIPLARDFTNGRECNLPVAMDVDADGKWKRGDVKDDYKDLWEIAVKWWDYIGQSAEDRTLITTFDACDLAVNVLGHNYHVGVIEVACLRIMDDEFIGMILDGLCDIPSLNEIIKKNRAIELLNIPDGQQEEHLATVQQ